MKHKVITEEQILNSRFCKVHESLTRIEATIPPYKEVEKLDYRTLCILVGVLGLRVRDLPGSVKNANYWLENHTKDEMLELFNDEFGQ